MTPIRERRCRQALAGLLPAFLVICFICIIFAAPRAQGWPYSIELHGLTAPVEIIRDPWGLSHIYADNERDLFFAQGFNAARDRLFQLEIWRRQATGTMAEAVGRRELQRDVGARLLRFRGDMARELDHYHPRGTTIIAAFAEGINAYIDHVERHPELMPLELRLLGMRPGRWTPEIVVSRHQGLYGNLELEVGLAQAVHLAGRDTVKELMYFHPGEPTFAPDEALDLSHITGRILEVYRAHRRPVRFTPEDIAPEHRGERQAFEALERALAADVRLPPDEIGSNNWVVSGRLTHSGLPIMANDPHRVQQAPSLRYWAHLVAPGWNVIGGGEPALPGISIGHNGTGAWGLTIFGIDTEDLYVYDTSPENPLQYRYRGAWEDMRVIRETIPVKGEPPVEVGLKYTRHGPVLHEDTSRRKAYALRAAWLEVGAAPYLASLRMNQAATWEEFREACTFSFTPAENMVWADVHGTIGWQAVGIAPLRRNWDGLLPVSGDGRYEWDGFLPVGDLPHVANPGKGYWSTANQNLVPAGYPHRQAVAWTWADPYRGSRVDEVLGSGRKFGVAEMTRLQHDELSIPARSLVPLLRGLALTDAGARKARDLLQGWDHVLDRDSVPAAIYVAWERRLQENVRERLVPEPIRPVLPALRMKKLIDWLVAPDRRFGADPIAGRDALLARSLEEAVAGLRERLGTDVHGWQYGQPRYKHALIRHPLSASVSPALRNRLDVGPLPRGGNAFTVNNTASGDNQTSGASFRIVAAVGDWDSSVGTNTPGQSGDPDSPHYRDLFELWARDRYFPVLYSRDKVAAAGVEVLRLLPADRSP